VWKRHIGSVCLAAAIWDSAQSRLFIASDATTVNGQTVEGAVRQLNPSTGATIWETALPGPVFGTASLDGAGVLAISLYQVADHSGNGTYLVDASNGAILAALPTGGAGFSQPVFANGYLFVASVGGRLTAFAPPG
jgi:outer membrane protein assembly factor BamB